MFILENSISYKKARKGGKAKEALEKLLKLEKGMGVDTPAVEIIKKLKESKKDEDALLFIQTCQEFPDLFSEDTIENMYLEFLGELNFVKDSDYIKILANYKTILAGFAIYYYTRARHLERLILVTASNLPPFIGGLDRAIELHPTNPALLTALGIHQTLSMDVLNPEKALNYLNQSIAYSSNGCNGLAYAFKAWNLFLICSSKGNIKKTNTTKEEKKEIEDLFIKAITISPLPLNWFLYASYLSEVFKNEVGEDEILPDYIIAAFSQAIQHGIHDKQFCHLIMQKCIGPSYVPNNPNDNLMPSLNTLTISDGQNPSLMDKLDQTKKKGHDIKIVNDSLNDVPLSLSSSTNEARKETKKTGDSSRTLLRQFLIEKANEEKAAQETNAAAAASTSSSSSSSSSSSPSKVKKDQAALQEFAEKQRQAEALEAARRQKELDLEREEKAKNREQRIPKHVLMQQEILRKKEQEKLLQEQRKKEQKKKPNAPKPTVQTVVETSSQVTPEPSSYSSTAISTTSTSKVSPAASRTLVADNRIGGIALVKDKEADKPLKEKKSQNVSAVTAQVCPKISQTLETRLRAAKTAIISIEGLIARYNRGEYNDPAEATKLKFNLMYHFLKLTETLCDTSDKKHRPEENAPPPLSSEDKEFINSTLAATDTLYSIRNDIRSYFHLVTLTRLLNLAREIQKSPLRVNLDNILNNKPLAQKTTLLQLLCDAEDRVASDKIFEEQKGIGTALTFKLMHENFQLMFQFIKLKIDNFSEFWKSDEVKSACKTAISNLRKCLLLLSNYYDLKKLFDVKGSNWTYVEGLNFQETAKDLLDLIDAGNRVGHHLVNIGEFSIDDLSDTYVYQRSCQAKKLEQFIAYTLAHKFPANIVSLFKSIPDAVQFIRTSSSFPKAIMEEIHKQLNLFENLAAKVKTPDALNKNIILLPMTKTFWNDLKNSIKRLPASSAARIWDALKMVHQELKADGEPSPAAIFQLINKAKEISSMI